MSGDAAPIIGLVLHFRTPERTLECLRSQQQEGIRCVLVVDNSEDGGRSLVTMAGGIGALRRAGLEVVVLRSDRNLGFARGVALGLDYIAAQRPGHVLLINSDATLQPNALQSMRDRLDEAGVVAPQARSSAGADPVSSLIFYHRLGGLYLKKPSWCTVVYPSGTCLLIRNDLVRSDLFDQEFFFYGEDVKFGYDLARQGIVFSSCHDASIVHAGSVSSGNGSMFYEYHMNRAHWLLARKLARNRFEQCIFALARCVVLPLRASIRSVRFCSLVSWKALIVATSDVIRCRCRSFTPPA